MKETKTEVLKVRLTPMALTKLDAIAKDKGIDRSKAMRLVLEQFLSIPVVGRVNSETGHITLTNGEVEIVGHDNGRE